MDKEREIEEMASAISECCEEKIEKNRCASLRCEMCMAEFMFKNGYRKADEVRKETLIGVVDYLRKSVNVPMTRVVDKLTYLLENSFGVEVDE